MNILIIGHRQHGKGTVADFLRDEFDMSVKGTSIHTAEYIYSLLKHKYNSVEECYLDRDSCRNFWFDKINEYCANNPARVIEEIYQNNQACEGVRHRIEFEAAKNKGHFDLILWVDASLRKPLEPVDSMQLNKEDAHVILDNNGTKEEFICVLRAYFRNLFFNNP